MRTFMLLGILALPFATQSAEIPEPTELAIQKALDNGSLQSLLVMTIDGDATASQSFGTIAPDDRAPNTDDLFEIGSITKVFTALAVQRLVEKDMLGWSDTLGQHFPDWELDPKIADITLQELATHRSGLPRMPSNFFPPNPFDPYAHVQRKHLLEGLQSVSTKKWEKSYAYSNLGVGLLGQIALQAHETEFAGLIDDLVTTPLAMQDTVVSPQDALAERLVDGYHQHNMVSHWHFTDAYAGAGALRADASDLAQFAKAYISGDSSIASAMAAVAERQDVSGQPMGLGWHIAPVSESEHILWHNGGTYGFASALLINTQTRKSVIALANSPLHGPVTEWAFAIMKHISAVP